MVLVGVGILDPDLPAFQHHRRLGAVVGSTTVGAVEAGLLGRAGGKAEKQKADDEETRNGADLPKVRL